MAHWQFDKATIAVAQVILFGCSGETGTPDYAQTNIALVSEDEATTYCDGPAVSAGIASFANIGREATGYACLNDERIVWVDERTQRTVDFAALMALDENAAKNEAPLV
jgi:hypothetical protein